MCPLCGVDRQGRERAPDAPETAPPPRAPGRNWPGPYRKTPGRLLGMGLIRTYQLTLSGFVGNGCRHLPTCSEYGFEAVARHGLWAGSLLAAWRVARCGPGGSGGFDPVPQTLSGRLSWLVPWRKLSR